MAIVKLTVKSLKALLSQYPDDTPIVVSGDSEGNHYHPLTNNCDGGLNPVTFEKYGVEIHSDDDAPDDADVALILYPD